MATNSEDICLRWNTHQTSVMSVFDFYYQKESFVDVTLAAEGKLIRVHRLVLCACSSYFEDMLKHQLDKQAIVFLKDVRFSELKHLVDFMYKGEISIAQEDLPQFLATARSLQIKGLGNTSKDNTPTDETSSEVIVLDDKPEGSNRGSSHLPEPRQPRPEPNRRTADDGHVNRSKKRFRSSLPRAGSTVRNVAGLPDFPQADSASGSPASGYSLPAPEGSAAVLNDPLSVDPLSIASSSQEGLADENFVDIATEDDMKSSDDFTSPNIQQLSDFPPVFSMLPAAQPPLNESGYLSCPRCRRMYKDRRALQRHVALCGVLSVFTCVICGKSYKRKDILMNHVKTHATTNSSS